MDNGGGVGGIYCKSINFYEVNPDSVKHEKL
jgi:hypothetical protein